MSEYSIFTSESVSEGHPDKMADQISDAILDAIIVQDPLARVACETLVTTDYCCMAGEITTKAKLDFVKLAREAIREIGYVNDDDVFHADKVFVNTIITQQSPDIAQGETLIEYVGEVITWKEAQRRHPHDPNDPNHTFYFHVDEKRVIDALHGGNSSRWINHSCDPNCEADEENGRVFIKALRNIRAGEELNYDYGLIIDEPYTPKLKAEYPCWCNAKDCRGTLLAPKRRRR